MKAFALTDDDWRIVTDLVGGRHPDHGRWLADAALFCLRSGRRLGSLPPFSGGFVASRVRCFVRNRISDLAYDATVEVGSPTVLGLDVSRFTGIEKDGAIGRPPAC